MENKTIEIEHKVSINNTLVNNMLCKLIEQNVKKKCYFKS